MADNDTSGGFFGGYSGLGDMVDGGGPGQSGDTFGGALGGMSNAAGASPMGSGRSATGIAGGLTSFGDFFGGAAKSGGGVSPASVRDGAGSYGADVYGGGESSGGSVFMTPTQTLTQTAMEPAQAAPPPELVQWLANKNTYGDLSDWVAAYPASSGSAMDYLSGDDVSEYNRARSEVPQFAEGGYVGPGGQPIRPDAPPAAAGVGVQGGPGQPGAMGFAQIEAQIQQFVQSNPQAVQQIQQEVQAGLMSGELTPDALNMFVQVATVALQNPDMWPQLRRSLIQQGFMDAEDIAEDYDQGFLIMLYLTGKVMGGAPQAQQAQQPQQPMMSGGQPQQPPMSAGQPPMMSMETGGALPTTSPNPDGSIPIDAHEGEYVVPADVVRTLGTQHFDNLITKTRTPPQTKGPQT